MATWSSFKDSFDNTPDFDFQIISDGSSIYWVSTNAVQSGIQVSKFSK